MAWHVDHSRHTPVPTDLVWHYTDAGGALGILTKHELWATHARHMNDSEELQRYKSVVVDVIRRLQEDSAYEDMAKPLDGARETFEGWAGDNYFVVSFSSEPDALSQWRAYGGGVGYAIGFKRDALARIGFPWKLVQCNYDADSARSEILPVILAGIEELRMRKLAEPLPRPLERRHVLDLWQIIYRPLMLNAPMYKDRAFHEEKEWRLIGGPLTNKFTSFRTTAYGISPYVPVVIPRSPDGTLVIPEVVVGPGSTDETVQGLHVLVKHNKDYPNTVVYSSDAPYRGRK